MCKCQSLQFDLSKNSARAGTGIRGRKKKGGRIRLHQGEQCMYDQLRPFSANDMQQGMSNAGFKESRSWRICESVLESWLEGIGKLFQSHLETLSSNVGWQISHDLRPRKRLLTNLTPHKPSNMPVLPISTIERQLNGAEIARESAANQSSIPILNTNPQDQNGFGEGA